MSPPHEEFLGSNIIMVDIDSSVQARVRVISRRPSCPEEEGGREGRQLFFARRPLDPNSNLFHVSFSKQMKNFSLPPSLSPPNFGHSQHNGGGRGCVGGVSGAVGRNKSHRKRQKWMKRTFRTFSLALFANFQGKLFTSLLQLAPPRQTPSASRYEISKL